MSRRILIALVAAVSVLAMAAPSRAEGGKLIGTVVGVDVAGGTMSVAESHGEQAMEFQVDAKSRVTVRASRQTLELAEIPAGSTVSVTYEPAAGEGELPRVRHMQVVPLESAPDSPGE